MTECTEFRVNRENLRTTKITHRILPPPESGKVLVAIDKFALTANNISYALVGDQMGYWQFYPAEDPWGKTPVWGAADVIASNCPQLPVGDRLWGFFPMASHTILEPGNITPDQFTDVTAHRRELPGIYNNYRRTRAEPREIQDFETERCLLLPLFATSFILTDYLVCNEFFGANQVLIGSVSSKTGFGLAWMLQDHPQASAGIIGFTSPSNHAFVDSLECCDRIMLYGTEDQLDANQPTAWVDMSGDGRLMTALHHHFGANLKASILVGATHWEHLQQAENLPGAQPEFFFAPGHIATREKDWGRGVPMMKAMEASIKMIPSIRERMSIDWIRGAEDLQSTWQDLLDNKVPASRGLMVSLLPRG